MMGHFAPRRGEFRNNIQLRGTEHETLEITTQRWGIVQRWDIVQW
jgi:hypothetical protein